jgi:PAS domain S-box-containing protein
MKKEGGKKTTTDTPGSPQLPVAGKTQVLDALRESESILRSFFDSSGVMRGIVEVIAEDDMRHITANPVTSAFLGLAPDAMRNKCGSELGTPRETLRMWVAHFTESQKSKKPVSFEYLDQRGGSWFHVTVSFIGTPPHGHPRFAYVMVDITSRRQAEEKLKAANEDLESNIRRRTSELISAVECANTERHRLFEVLEALPVYVCLLDEDYRMPFANKYFRESFREPQGRRCYEFLFNRSEPCEICETYTVMKTREPHHWFWTGPNGRDYDIYDFPFTDSDGSFMILEMGIDITERKKAEDGWAVLASIVEHSEDAIIGKSLAGVIMSWNAGAAKMYGYSADEAIGQHVSVLLPPGMEDDIGYILERIRKGDPVFQYDTTRMKKDGSLIQVSLTVSPIKDRNGVLIGASSIARDISERKMNANAIEKASVYNRSLIESSLDPLVTIAPDGTISDVNAATIRITGYSRPELIGTDFSNYFTEPAKAKSGYMQAFRNGMVTGYALEIRNRNGHVTPVLYNATVYRDTQGNVIGVFASARDITERKKAEEALERANAYNRSLIEASLDPLVTIAPDGTISDVNEATIRITGYSRPELIGTDFSNYFTEPDTAKAGYEKVFRDGAVTDYALEIRNRNGQVTPVLYNASVYRDTQGTVIGVFAAARDITERKKAEEALRKAHDLLENRVEERTRELVQSNAQLKEEISQRKIAESLVKKTVSELYAAIESTADGIYVVDRAGLIVRYNQNFAPCGRYLMICFGAERTARCPDT